MKKTNSALFLAAVQLSLGAAVVTINDSTTKTLSELALENPGFTISDLAFMGSAKDPVKAFLTADEDFTFDLSGNAGPLRASMDHTGGIKAINAATLVFENSVGDATPGVIYNTMGAYFEVRTEGAGSSVTFKNNRTNHRGGAIENIGTLAIAGDADSRVAFIGNSVLNPDSGRGALGGAIYNGNDPSGAALTIEYADFTGNFTSSNALTSGGGAIYSDNSKLSLNHVNFTDNYSDGGTGGVAGGGAVAFSDLGDLNALISVSNSNFTGNYAKGGNGADGGALSTSVYGRNLAITSSTFNGNWIESGSVTAKGGAVFNTYGKNTTISDSSFTGNSATGTSSGYAYGGAIYTTTGLLDIADTDLNGNTATAKYALGGAIYYMGAFSIENGTMSGNSVVSLGTQAYGGAIYANHSSSVANSTIETITFESNSASGSGQTSGGAVYNASTGGIDFSGVDFIRNSAVSTDSSAYGGAVYNNKGAVTFDDVDFTENKAEGVMAMGGAVHSGTAVSFDGADFTSNSVKATMYGYGGALSANSTITVKNSTFTGNSAVSDNMAGGGAINVTFEAEIRNSTFSNNIVSGDSAYGGAIHNGGKLTLVDVSFTGNKATGVSEAMGGAIYHGGGSIELYVSTGKTSTFSGNQANGEANSIFFYEAGTLMVDTQAGAVLDMQDPMKGLNTYDGDTIELNKAGFGTWKMGGDNTFTVATNSSLMLNIFEGSIVFGNSSKFEANGALSTMTLYKNAELDLRGALSVNFSEGTIMLESNSVLKFDGDKLTETYSPLFGKTLDLNILSVGEKVQVEISSLASLEIDDALLVIGYEHISSEYGTGIDANDYFNLRGWSVLEYFFEWRSDGLYIIKGEIPEPSTCALIAALLAIGVVSFRRRAKN